MKPATNLLRFADATDTDLATAVTLHLNAHHPSCKGITVRAEEGTISLSGSVRSFFFRQMAIALSKQVVGVRRVVDDLEVNREDISS